MASNYYQQNLGTSSSYPLELTGPVNITNLTYVYPPIISTNSNFTSGTNINTSFTFTIANQTYGNGTYIYSCQNQYISMTFLNLLVNGVFGSTAIQGWEPSNDGNPNKYSSTSPYALINNSSGATTATNGITYYGLWLQVQLPQSIYINGVYIAPVYGAPTAMPGIIQVVGSTNGSSWEYIGQISGIIPVVGENKLYPLNILPLFAYTYFRFIVTNIYGNYSGVRITQFYVTGTTSSSALQMNTIQKIINGSGSIVTSNILPQSYVGIGTTIPSHPVHIYSNYSTGNGGVGLGIYTPGLSYGGSGTIIFGDNYSTNNAGLIRYVKQSLGSSLNYIGISANGTSTDQVCINTTGYVGIGSTNPNVPLYVSGYANFNIGGNTGTLYGAYSTFSLGNNYTNQVSIACSNFICSWGLMAISDRRIKTNIIQADTSVALSKILELPLMKYDYIDKIEYGPDNVYGLIAQHVKEILPECVTLVTKIIPSIYKLSTNIILSDDKENVIISVEIPETSEIKVNCIVELCIDGFQYKHQTKVISFTSSQLVVKKWDNFDETKMVFVYGVEIDNFNTIDKAYLGVLCMGGIQELSKLNTTLQNQVSTLQQQVDTMQNQIATLIAHMNTTKS